VLTDWYKVARIQTVRYSLAEFWLFRHLTTLCLAGVLVWLHLMRANMIMFCR
jgi:hypothetical protein